MPSASCTRRCAASARSSCAGRRPSGAGRRRACRRPRRLLGRRHGRPRRPSPGHHRTGGGRGLPPEDWRSVIVATGPLTSPALAEAVLALTGEKELAFFDAIAPIAYRDSIDMGVAWFQSRYDKAGPGGTGADYINCPSTGTSTTPSWARCSMATRRASRSGRGRRISTAACRSRSWPSADARPCDTGR